MTIKYISGGGFLAETDRDSRKFWSFQVEGLQPFNTPEDHQLANNDYKCWVASNPPEGALFTIMECDGGWGYSQLSKFYICEVVAAEKHQQTAKYGNGFIKGNYRVVVRAETPVKANRLFRWWEKSKHPKTLAYADHCAAYLEERGLKKLPPMGEPIQKVKNVSVSLDVAQYDRLKEIAREADLSIGDILQEAVRDYLSSD